MLMSRGKEAVEQLLLISAAHLHPKRGNIGVTAKFP